MALLHFIQYLKHCSSAFPNVLCYMITYKSGEDVLPVVIYAAGFKAVLFAVVLGEMQSRTHKFLVYICSWVNQPYPSVT